MSAVAPTKPAPQRAGSAGIEVTAALRTSALDPDGARPIALLYRLWLRNGSTRQVDLRADAALIGARIPIELTHPHFRDAEYTQLKAVADWYVRHMEALSAAWARQDGAPPAPAQPALDAAGAAPWWVR